MALECTERGAHDDRFLGRTTSEGGLRVYGGHSLAQAALAAGQTVSEPLQLIAIHTQFPRPAAPGEPVLHAVQRPSTGAGAAVRQVVSTQAGKVIAITTACFRTSAGAIDETYVAMPDLPGPDAFRNERLLFLDLVQSRGIAAGTVQMLPTGIDGRWTDRADPDRPVPMAAHHAMWLRMTDMDEGAMPILLKRLGIAYLSDYMTLEVALRPHAVVWPSQRLVVVGTFDHSIWLHRHSDPREWHLRTATVATSVAGLTLVRGDIFDRAGGLVASYTQQGVFRIDG